MEDKIFYDLLAQALEFPFNIEDVESVEENCGTVWVVMKDHSIYSVTVSLCEPDDETTEDEQ